MQKYGFEAGANWSKSPDSPHFQVNSDFGTYFTQDNNTKTITIAIQKALNDKVNTGLKEDGCGEQKRQHQ